MSRMPEASFSSPAPATAHLGSSSRASFSAAYGLLYWMTVVVLAIVGWIASASLHLAHAGDVSWSIGVNVPGGVIQARTEPPVVVYQQPVPVYNAPVYSAPVYSAPVYSAPAPVYAAPPVVVHRPAPPYIVAAPPPVVWVDHPPRWQQPPPRHPHHPHYNARHEREGHYRNPNQHHLDPYAHRNPHYQGNW